MHKHTRVHTHRNITSHNYTVPRQGDTCHQHISWLTCSQFQRYLLSELKTRPLRFKPLQHDTHTAHTHHIHTTYTARNTLNNNQHYTGINSPTPSSITTHRHKYNTRTFHLVLLILPFLLRVDYLVRVRVIIVTNGYRLWLT